MARYYTRSQAKKKVYVFKTCYCLFTKQIVYIYRLKDQNRNLCHKLWLDHKLKRGCQDGRWTQFNNGLN